MHLHFFTLLFTFSVTYVLTKVLAGFISCYVSVVYDVQGKFLTQYLWHCT